jgi:hypothetical protein
MVAYGFLPVRFKIDHDKLLLLCPVRIVLRSRRSQICNNTIEILLTINLHRTRQS